MATCKFRCGRRMEIGAIVVAFNDFCDRPSEINKKNGRKATTFSIPHLILYLNAQLRRPETQHNKLESLIRLFRLFT